MKIFLLLIPALGFGLLQGRRAAEDTDAASPSTTAIAPHTEIAASDPTAPTPSEHLGYARVHVTMASVDLRFYCQNAESVVVGTVVSRHVMQSEIGLWCTRYELDVDETIVGETADRLSVLVAGAPDAPLPTYADHAPRLQLGDELLLFTCTDEQHTISGILGLERGTYRIGRATDGERIIEGLHAPAGTRLAAFSDQIRALRAQSSR